MAGGSGGTVLVVEDDPGVARLQKRRLEQAGYVVRTAATADEAQAAVETDGVELMVLDYRLPGGVTGLDLYARLKAAGHDVPVILVTGFSDDATVIQALRAGVRDYVTKSVRYLDYLPEAVQRVLRQVRTEHELAESRARLAAVIDSALDAIVTVDGEERVTLFNPAAEQVFRCPAAEALGQPLGRFIPSGLPGLPSRTAGFPGAVRGVRADGEEFPLEASVARVEVAGQTVRTLIVRDVTERERVEEALRESNRSLEKALADLQARTEEVKAMTQQLWQAAKLASVGELAASIAHELNNPLATVSLRLEAVLGQTPADDPRRRPLEVVEQEVDRMAKLVGNLLHFSRRGSDQVSTVDVRTELLRTLELVQYHLRHYHIVCVQELAADLPLIYADREKLRQVFLNLITNASDAMPEGGTLTLRASNGTLPGGRTAVVLEFADSGLGIPPEHLPRVMDPFFTTKAEGKGTGLGLAICRRVVQEHHGTIHIQSTVGTGTTVRVVLPVNNGANVTQFHS